MAAGEIHQTPHVNEADIAGYLAGDGGLIVERRRPPAEQPDTVTYASAA